MRQKLVCMILAIWLLLCFAPSALAFAFSDSEFLGRYTTEALDEIIDKYELYNGWYWTSEAGVLQDYHGQAGKPGWTDTAVNGNHRYGYEKGWYGCRWGIDRINEKDPNDYGYGECFGFAQFIGYLLSGDQNAHGNWDTFSTVKLAGGLKVGDIIRVDYYMEGRHCVHSAVVYSVGEGETGKEIRYLQVAGGQYNLIRSRTGFYDGRLMDETALSGIASLPGLRIYRSPGNK